MLKLRLQRLRLREKTGVGCVETARRVWIVATAGTLRRRLGSPVRPATLPGGCPRMGWDHIGAPLPTSALRPQDTSCRSSGHGAESRTLWWALERGTRHHGHCDPREWAASPAPSVPGAHGGHGTCTLHSTGTMADTPRRRAASTRTTDSPAISVRGEGLELTSSHKNTKITTAEQPEKTGTYKKGHLTFKDKEGTMRW